MQCIIDRPGNPRGASVDVEQQILSEPSKSLGRFLCVFLAFFFFFLVVNFNLFKVEYSS